MQTMSKILILIFAAALLFLIRRALFPLAIGIAAAYVLDPFVEWLSAKLNGRRLAAVCLAYLSVILAAAFLILGFADIITGQIAKGSVQEALSVLRKYYEEYSDFLPEIFNLSANSSNTAAFLQNLGSGAADFLVGMIAGVYLLKDKAFFLRLVNQTAHLLLKQKTHGKLREILFEIHQVVSAFLRGVLVDSVIVAFAASLTLSLLGVKFAVLIGCFAGITNVIPYFGPFIGIVPAVLSALADGGLSLAAAAGLSLFAVQQIECNFIYPRIIGKSTGLHPLFVLISVSADGGLSLAAAAGLSLFAVQQIECNFIYPRIIGKSTGLHPLFVLISVSAAASVGGLFLMILAVPIAGIIKVLVSKWAVEQ